MNVEKGNDYMRIIIDSGIDKDHPLLKEYDIRQIKYKKSTNNSFIKREWLNRFNINNYRHAYNLIFEYIETFYNTVRIHSHCGYLSPNEYEEQYLKNLETDVTNLAS